ncbi:phage terminase large subunit [Bacillus sp. SL00103]
MDHLKSYHIALKLVLKLIQEKRTALVVREVYDTHRDSTFSLLERDHYRLRSRSQNSMCQLTDASEISKRKQDYI